MSAQRISDLQVERLALGELDAKEADRIRAALEATRDPRLESILASNREILDQYPAAELTRAIRERAHRSPPAAAESASWIPLVAVPLGLAAAVGLAFIGLYGLPGFGTGTSADEIARLDPIEREPTTQKGALDPQLSVVRREAGVPRTLADGDSASAGDVLQVTYTAAGAGYGVVVSIDGRGEVTLHHPATAAEATALAPGEGMPLAHAYELDDAPSFERFFLVTADKPMDVDTVMTAANTLAEGDAQHGSLDVQGATAETSLLLVK